MKLERKNQDIEKQLTSERKMQQDAMSSICREFEKDKSELQSKHDSEVKSSAVILLILISNTSNK